jgi:4-amino-4-deoxy-L-arabinose transferase-like glycosyltransferase
MTPSEPAGEAPRRLAPWQAALLILVAAALFWPGQTTIPPVDRDETRFAQATLQMLQSGDYVDIRFQEDPRYQKPVGIYWLQAAAVALLSDAEARAIWAYRVPSFLAAIAAVLLTARLGARMAGGPAGLLAGLLLASTVLMNVEARLAKTDAVLLVAILAAMSALWRAYEAREGPRRLPWGWTLLFWGALGAGILVKGPIAPMVVGLAAAALVAVERRARWLLPLRPLSGLAVAAAIALPWYVAIHLETGGAFLARSAGEDLLGKLLEGDLGRGFPPGYHLVVSAAAMWPSALILALAVPWIRRERRQPAVRFCLAWAVPTWIVFEITVSKLPHYVLPAYPALLILAAAAAFARREELVSGGSWWTRRLAKPFLAIFAAVGAGLAVGPLAVALALDGDATRAAFSVALAGLALVVWLAVALHRGQATAAAHAMPAAAFLAVSLNLGVTLPGVDAIWFNRQIPRIAEQAAPCPDYRIATAPLDLESVVFLTGTDTAIERMDRIADMLRAPPDCAVLFLEDPQAAELRRRLADAPLDWRETGRRVTGFNFSNGRRVDLGVYRVEPTGEPETPGAP